VANQSKLNAACATGGGLQDVAGVEGKNKSVIGNSASPCETLCEKMLPKPAKGGKSAKMWELKARPFQHVATDRGGCEAQRF
jgi:hypothetical protein